MSVMPQFRPIENRRCAKEVMPLTVVEKEEHQKSEDRKLQFWKEARALIWFACRFACFIGLLAIWPIFFRIAKLLKNAGKPIFSCMFLVYPATQKEIRGYMPLWFHKYVCPNLMPLGFITGKKTLGLVMAARLPIDELERDIPALEKLITRVRMVAGDIGPPGLRVALAGRLPSVLAANKLRHLLQAPFVSGELGTVYTILRTIGRSMLAQGWIDLSNVQVGVIGLGFIGSKLIPAIRDSLGAKEMVVYDIRTQVEEQKAGILYTNNPERLIGSELIVVLTPRGKDIEPIVHFIKGAVVVDDTYPQLPLRVMQRVLDDNGSVYKATLVAPRTRILPRLTRWDPTWLPGCLVQALVQVQSGEDSEDQERFNAHADRTGLEAPAARHRFNL